MSPNWGLVGWKKKSVAGLTVLSLATVVIGIVIAQEREKKAPPTPGPMLEQGYIDVETPAFSLRLVRSSQTVAALKPKGERDASAGEVIARLRPQLEKVEGARLFLQAAQDVNIGGRIARTQFQYTLQDANLDELNQWSPKVLEKLKSCRCCAM